MVAYGPAHTTVKSRTRIPLSGKATIVRVSFILPLTSRCQMDTFFRLGWSRTHNTIHSGQVTQMLKATPQCLGSRLVAATASHKTTELCNPTDSLLQRWRLFRRRWTVMDGT